MLIKNQDFVETEVILNKVPELVANSFTFIYNKLDITTVTI